jgi:cardiolipin synthase (CMP-forming)
MNYSKNKQSGEVFMNIPNIITMVRFLLIPVFVYFFFSENQYSIEIAVAVFILSGITDTLDGYIARRYNQITKLGIVLDPLADKIMLITVLASVTISNNIPIWIIAVVAIKEILMIAGAISLYNERDIVIPANIFGKISTLLSYIAILAVLFELPYNRTILYSYIAMTTLSLFIYLNRFLIFKRQNQFGLIKK